MLTCTACRRAVVFPLAMRIELLKSRGRLLRAKNPDPQLVHELLTLELPDLPCDFCGHRGLVLSEPKAADGDGLDDEHWGEARRCIGCGVTIDPERLEILPDTFQCTPCSAAGRTSREDQREFCHRCGSEMKLTDRSGRGLAGYVMKCTGCGST